jgi:YVTN family beta-propeller protein
MKTSTFWLFFLSGISLLFSACQDDMPPPPVTSDARALLVVNQGNFSQGNGSIDLYYTDSLKGVRNAYALKNGEALGGIIESVSIEDTTLLIITNVADQVLLASARSLEKEWVLQDPARLKAPRYAAIGQNRIFVSSWGAFEADWSLKNSAIVVLNRATGQIETSIPVPAGPEGVLLDGNRLWVANSYTDTLTIINASTLEIERKIKTSARPSKVARANNGQIWVLAGSQLFAYNPGTFALAHEYTLPGSATKWQLSGNNLYFLTQEYSADWSSTYNTLYSLAIGGGHASPVMIREQDNARTFWVDPQDGDIYLGIAAGAEPGTLLRLTASGTELDREPAGVFPYQLILR